LPEIRPSVARALAAANAATVIVTMLPTDEALQQVVEGPDGLLSQLRAGQVLIDMSTSKLATSQRLAALVAGRGAYMLDAPVSGGEQGARSGTLSIMVGGDRAVFERCRPLLAAMGTTLTYIGGNGMGLVAKLVKSHLAPFELLYGLFDHLRIADQIFLDDLADLLLLLIAESLRCRPLREHEQARCGKHEPSHGFHG
jgi:3-hydroxyisobutyrate dehydrogenase-like beta-hydroxyacid dehydrogenase